MGGKSDNQEFDFLSHFWHPACFKKRAGKLWTVGQKWTITNFSKQSWTGTQLLPFADVLSLPAFIHAMSTTFSSCNRDSMVHKTCPLQISLLSPALKERKTTGHGAGRTTQTSRGRKAVVRLGKRIAERTHGQREGEGEKEGGEEGGADRRWGWASGGNRERCQPTRPSDKEVKQVAYPILWNCFQKLTDLNANPGGHQTVPEISLQFCTPGWSRVPGEKTIGGKILGSVLGKQRKTNDRESQWDWMKKKKKASCAL